MSAYVLLNELGKRDKMQGLSSVEHFISFFAASLKNSIIQEHECKILCII